MNTVFINRFKSFAWRTGMMLGVVVADQVIQNLAGFGLPAYATILVGLLAGEVSKFLNTELSTLPVVKKVATKKKK